MTFGYYLLFMAAMIVAGHIIRHVEEQKKKAVEAGKMKYSYLYQSAERHKE